MYHLLCDCVLLLIVTVVKIACQPEEAIRYRVQEGVPVGTRIGNVLFDSGIRRRYTKDVLHKLDFRFLSPPQIPLSIGVSDAVLRTIGPIDRESITPCRQKVTCDVSVDVAVHPLSYFRIVKVVLEVIDVNDNPPWFAPSQHSTLMISESASVGATFLLPSATDPDSPQYGVRRYALYPVGGGGRHDDSIDSKFILRETPKLDGFLDVRLMLRQKLDREMVEEYHLTLVAFDGGEPALNDSISVTVRVLDSNDNDPVFEKSVYEVHIAENVRPGTRILSVRATDADLEGTAQLVYGLAAQTRSFYGHAFLVDNRTGDVYVTDRLDRETLAEYQLIVTAEDAPVGSPEVHTVDVTVHVTLDDVNDNAPRIVINTLQAADSSFAHVTENSPSGTFVAHVTATDPDTDGNGIINCTLRTSNGGRSDGSGLLRLVPRPLHQSQLRSEVDYQLVTSGLTIDRERTDDLNVSVTCSDNGVPAAQTSVKHLRVFVNDENDNSPAFKSQEYKISVAENVTAGSAIFTVEATDPDSSQNAMLRYVIRYHETDPVVPFDIDTQTGLITTTRMLDRERLDHYKFNVEAADSGTPTSLTGTALVVVIVTDVDDNVPKFTNDRYRFTVLENRPPGSFVGDITARDLDLPPYNSFKFRLIPENEATATFDLNPNNGTLRTRRIIDRETQPVYYLTACVYSRHNEVEQHQKVPHHCDNTASVTIVVDDVNDNLPVFEFPSANNHTAQVSLYAPIGHVVTTVVAKDFDEGNNGHVKYSLQQRSDVIPFQIEPQTGRLTVSRKLSLDSSEREFKEYSIEIVATDHGSPPRFRPQHLTVVVNKSISLLANDVKQLSAHNIPSRDKSRGSSVIVAVTVSVGSILLITVILVVMLLRRRRRHRTCSKYTAAVTSTATCSNMSPTCMTTSSSSGFSVQHNATIPRLYVSKGHRHSDEVISQTSQGQCKGDDKPLALPGVDFLFTDCRPLQPSDQVSTNVWKKRSGSGLHCSPASSCPAHQTSTLPHRLWPSTHHRPIDSTYSYSPRPPVPSITLTSTQQSTRPRQSFDDAIDTGSSEDRRDITMLPKIDSKCDVLSDVVSGTVIL